MSSAQFKLDMFEGPLDLLLHLISKHKLNIHDIEISLLLEQYLEYMHQLDHEDLEDAADFLEMAARLIYIKTVSLLPQDEEAQELKKELEGRLIEYSQCKQLAKELAAVYAGGSIFVRKAVVVPVDKTYTREHDPQVLLEAYLGLSEKARNQKPINAKIFQPIVSYKVVSVGSKIVYILKKLYTQGSCDLSHIYDGMETKSEKVATFLAILELTKSGRIVLNDDNTCIFFSESSRNHRKKTDDTEDSEKSSFDDPQQPEVEPDIPADTAAAEEAEPQVEQPESASLSVQEQPAVEITNEQEPAVETTEEQETVEETTNEEHSYEEQTLEERLQEELPEFVPDDTPYEPPESISVQRAVSWTKQMNERVAEPVSVVYSPKSTLVQAEPAPEKIQEEITDISPEQEQPVTDEITPTDPTDSSPFKPNYWGRLRHYWGNVPTGDDAQRNYWRFGLSRL